MVIEIRTATIPEKGQITILKDGRITALLSERALARDWTSKEEDDAWKKL